MTDLEALERLLAEANIVQPLLVTDLGNHSYFTSMEDDLIVAAVNALPSMIAELRAARADVEKLDMKVRLYRAYNSPEPAHRQAAFRDAMMRADIAESALAAIAKDAP